MPDPLDAVRLPVVPVEPRPEFAAGLLRRIKGTAEPPASRPATMRYFVTDLDAAVAFYRDPTELFEPLAAYHERSPQPAG